MTNQKDRGTDARGSVAQAVRSSTQRLRRLIDVAGDRQPAVFIGSAFVLGIAGARFLKSSHHQNEYGYGSESRRGMYGGQPQMSTGRDRGAWNRGDANTTVAIEEVVISEIEPDTTASGRSEQRSRPPGSRTKRS